MKLVKNLTATKYDISRLKLMYDSNALFIDNSF